MSVLSSTSPFMLNLNTQGLFSSQTAFQKPKINKSFQPFPKTNLTTSFIQSQKSLSSKIYKPVQITPKNQDSDFVFCKPVKKVKLTQDQSTATNLLNKSKKESQQTSSKLTIEMVFDAPSKSKKSQLNDFFDEELNDDTSLSFISSCSSLEDIEAIDEEITEVQGNKSNKPMILNVPEQNTDEAPLEPLFVKDNFAGQMNYLNAGNYLSSNMLNYPMTMSYDQYNLFDLARYQPLMNFTPICAGDFVKNPTQFLLEEQEISAHLNNHLENIRAKIADSEEGYDSDSHATRSTGLEPNQDGKSGSPPYSIGEDILIEEKIQIESLDAPKKKKRGRKPNGSVQRRADKINGEFKSKKSKPLNLDIDINPKHLKVERRLNKLQLLRYQQEAPEGEFEDYMRRISEVEALSRNNSLFAESNDSQSICATSEGKIDVTDSQTTSYEKTLATIPPLCFEPSRRRPTLATISTPENLKEEDLENFMQRLGEIVEFPVTDQERCLKILKTFSMDMLSAIEAVRGNVEMYSELLKVKVKRLRRR